MQSGPTISLSLWHFLRQKELAEFIAEEKDSVQSISGLKAAIVAISKYHASMIQSDTVRNIADILGSHMGKCKNILEGVVTPSQKKAVTAFLPQGEKGSCAPQSGEIFGILTNMKESFEAGREEAKALLRRRLVLPAGARRKTAS